MLPPPPTELEANEAVIAFFRRLAAALRTRFPEHYRVMIEEIFNHKLTDNRWHRIASVLYSFDGIPSVPLSRDERDLRDVAIDSAIIAKKMAAAKLGIRLVSESRETAVWRIDDMDERLQYIAARMVMLT